MTMTSPFPSPLHSSIPSPSTMADSVHPPSHAQIQAAIQDIKALYNDCRDTERKISEKLDNYVRSIETRRRALNERCVEKRAPSFGQPPFSPAPSPSPFTLPIPSVAATAANDENVSITGSADSTGSKESGNTSGFDPAELIKKKMDELDRRDSLDNRFYGSIELRDTVKETMAQLKAASTSVKRTGQFVRSAFVRSEIDSLCNNISVLTAVFGKLLDRMALTFNDDEEFIESMSASRTSSSTTCAAIPTDDSKKDPPSQKNRVFQKDLPSQKDRVSQKDPPFKKDLPSEKKLASTKEASSKKELPLLARSPLQSTQSATSTANTALASTPVKTVPRSPSGKKDKDKTSSIKESSMRTAHSPSIKSAK